MGDEFSLQEGSQSANNAGIEPQFTGGDSIAQFAAL